MIRNGKPNLLPSRKLEEMLSKGGWSVSGGSYVQNQMTPDRRVVRASVLGEVLTIVTEGGTLEAPSNNIVDLGDGRIEVRHVSLRRQQRRKKEGGGWHDVPFEEAALRLTHLPNDSRAESEFDCNKD